MYSVQSWIRHCYDKFLVDWSHNIYASSKWLTPHPIFLNFRSKLLNKIEHSDTMNGDILFIFVKLARYVVQYMTQYEINVGGTCIYVPGKI